MIKMTFCIVSQADGRLQRTICIQGFFSSLNGNNQRVFLQRWRGARMDKNVFHTILRTNYTLELLAVIERAIFFKVTEAKQT